MNKAIQEERIRNFFLVAAKDLIRAEGISVISARNVAERAGYSYATLYNYFKDIRDLIFGCVEDFMQECRDFVAVEVGDISPGKGRLLAKTRGYVKFFVQYPGIFELLYQQKQSSISTPNSNSSSICTLLDSLIREDWECVMQKRKGLKDAIDIARTNHSYAIHGLLLFYINRRKPMEYKQLMDEIAVVTEFSLR